MISGQGFQCTVSGMLQGMRKGRQSIFIELEIAENPIHAFPAEVELINN